MCFIKPWWCDIFSNVFPSNFSMCLLYFSQYNNETLVTTIVLHHFKESFHLRQRAPTLSFFSISHSVRLPVISPPLPSVFSDDLSVNSPSLSYFLSHSLLCHSVFKDAASLGESLIQAPAFGLGSPVCVLLSPVSPSSRGVEAEHVLQGETRIQKSGFSWQIITLLYINSYLIKIMKYKGLTNVYTDDYFQFSYVSHFKT